MAGYKNVGDEGLGFWVSCVASTNWIMLCNIGNSGKSMIFHPKSIFFSTDVFLDFFSHPQPALDPTSLSPARSIISQPQISIISNTDQQSSLQFGGAPWDGQDPDDSW